MRIYGKLIGTLNGHTEDSPNLVNRVMEVYETKTKIKFVLFNSSNFFWKQGNNVLYTTELKKDGSVNVIEFLNKGIKSVMNLFDINFDCKILYQGNEIHYSNGMEIYNADYGWKGIDKHNNIMYYGAFTNDGKFYKDYSAWENNNGVIYISEGQLEDIDAEYKVYGKINEFSLWTKQTWIEYVQEWVYDNYEGCYETYDDITEEEYKKLINDEKFFEYVAYLCLKNCEWQDLSTYLIENENCEPWILVVWDEYKKEKMKKNEK
jgi:hypothetical protein